MVNATPGSPERRPLPTPRYKIEEDKKRAEDVQNLIEDAKLEHEIDRLIEDAKQEYVPKSETEAPPQPEKVETLAQTPEDSVEIDTRDKNEQLFNKSRSIDERGLLTGLEIAKQTPEVVSNLKTLIDRIESAEEKILTNRSLALGEELNKENLTDAGINAITKRSYEGDPPRVAFVKPKSGEAALVGDAEGDTAYGVRGEWNPETNRIEMVRTDLDEGIATGVLYWTYKTPEFRQAISEHYGVSFEETPAFESFTYRKGVEAGSLPVREYASSRINDIINWDIVPMTVLRYDEGNGDLMSVQEEVRSKEEGGKARDLENEDFADLLKQGPEHPGAKSFMRLACMDYLLKSTDRHLGNIFYDEATHEFTGIDNGFTLGLSVAEEGKERMMDPIVSIPREIVQEFPDWKLDEEAVDMLKDFYNQGTEYLKNLERDPSAVDKSQGVEQLSSVMKIVFGNEKIAKKEATELLKRIQLLIQNGRPENLEKSDALEDGKLYDYVTDLRAAMEADEAALSQAEQSDTPGVAIEEPAA